MSMRLEARGLHKKFGTVTAVQDFTHNFATGKITAILGPSGSGKSTTLSMIAGLIEPDDGAVYLDGKDITNLPAEKRDFGLVFQNYSLFPHLSVVENVEFGLRVRGIGKKERHQRALEALERVHIHHLQDRRVQQISGGEQQRVALARSIIYNPRVLLLDEPLSALDAKLREALRAELRTLLNALSITAIYVTHDQIEAMSLGHELIIMQEGKIEQAGPPFEVYSRPISPFVATFLGSANLLEGECVDRGGHIKLLLPFAELSVPECTQTGPCRVMVRPEDFVIVDAGEGQVAGEVTSSVFLGSQSRLTVMANGYSLAVDASNVMIPRLGTEVSLRVRETRLCILPKG